MSILVACIGNIFQGDDAFGCEVAKVLARRGLSPDVRVVDFGIRGIDLTYALLDAPELTILVDAVSRGGEPGTLYTIEPDLEDLEGAGETMGEQIMDAHTMHPLQVLRAVKRMGGRLGRVLLVGCEPADLGGPDGRMGLTPLVNGAIEQSAEMVESLIVRELQEVSQ
ncbi:MAG: hydrogenase maturation protease [Acidobacteriota bacterium]|nr:hydrogenase maturation protease [Acidobacteriota bacterium]